MIPSTSAIIEALQQILLRNTKRSRRNPGYLGFENDDSSGESTKSCPPNQSQPRRKRRAGDTESVQTSVVQTIANTAAHTNVNESSSKKLKKLQFFFEKVAEIRILFP